MVGRPPTNHLFTVQLVHNYQLRSCLLTLLICARFVVVVVVVVVVVIVVWGGGVLVDALAVSHVVQLNFY